LHGVVAIVRHRLRLPLLSRDSQLGLKVEVMWARLLTEAMMPEQMQSLETLLQIRHPDDGLGTITDDLQ
jgi:hypothetical protein